MRRDRVAVESRAMEGDAKGDVTVILERVRGGDSDAAGELFTLLYGELRGLAGNLFRSQQAKHTLQPTALVHEAFLKIMKPADGPSPWQDRAHFLAVAARAMRQILVNHARDRSAKKRGGGIDARRLTLAGVAVPAPGNEVEVLAVDEALEELKRLDEAQAKIAELRFFGGLTNREVAEVLGRSLRTIELEWSMAKRWLASRLGDES
jgi:RNA polymerase sigma factor (TIGR02999 family)